MGLQRLLHSFSPLPSLQHLGAEAARVARRFPLTLLCAFVLGGVGFYLVAISRIRPAPEVFWAVGVLLAAGLGRLADSLVAVNSHNLIDDEVSLSTEDLTLSAVGPTATLQLYLPDLTREQQGDTVRYSYRTRALLEIK